MAEPGYGFGVGRTVSLGKDGVKRAPERLDGGVTSAVGIEPAGGLTSPACALCAESVVGVFDCPGVVLEIEVDKLLCGVLGKIVFFKDRACFIDNSFVEGVSIRSTEIGVRLRRPGGFGGIIAAIGGSVRRGREERGGIDIRRCRRCRRRRGRC